MALQDLNPLRLARSVCSEFLFFPTDSTFFQLRVTLEHYIHGPLNAAPSFAKGIATEGMTPVGVTKLDFQCLGWRMDTGTLALACCVLQCYCCSLCLKLHQTLSMRLIHTVSLLNSISWYWMNLQLLSSSLLLQLFFLLPWLPQVCMWS